MKRKSQTITDTIGQTKISSNQNSCDYSNIHLLWNLQNSCDIAIISVKLQIRDTILESVILGKYLHLLPN
jgi:hypothetical protein